MNIVTKQIEENNLRAIKDELNYEALMNKKFNLYSQYCTDENLKELCHQSAAVHKQNFSDLRSYLESHQ